MNFLPLKSTLDEDRAAELERALGDENAVPPCSPKSMYRLAEKVACDPHRPQSPG